MRVREAKPQDVEALIALALMAHQDSRYAEFDFNVNKLRNFAPIVLSGGSRPCFFKCFVCTQDDTDLPVGFFLVHCVEYLFGYDLLAQEDVMFIHPDFRKQGATVLRFIRAFEKWADSLGAVSKQVGVSSPHHMQQMRKMFDAMGYTHAGYVYVKGANK